MNKYIFITKEGETYQPNSQSIEPDCENMQVIGIIESNTEKEAFLNLKESYLINSNFNEVICYKLESNFSERIFRKSETI